MKKTTNKINESNTTTTTTMKENEVAKMTKKEIIEAIAKLSNNETTAKISMKKAELIAIYETLTNNTKEEEREEKTMNTTTDSNESNNNNEITRLNAVFMKELDDENAKRFMNAVMYESVKYEKDSKAALIEKKKKAVKSEKTAADKKTILKLEIKGLKADIIELNAQIESLINDYETVVSEMTAKNEKGFGNGKKSVRNILRILASTENPKMLGYAFTGVFKGEALYNALMSAHVNCTVNTAGHAKTDDKAYSDAKKAVEHIVKLHVALPFETPYTEKFRINGVNGESMHKLHETFVTGISNKYETKDGVKTLKESKFTTAVNVKTDKNGVTTYDYTRLEKNIVNMLMPIIFA